jgi:metal-sulfur cluster biosynthetic enzyme
MQMCGQNATTDALLAALRHVVEPQLGINVVDLGLVYAAHVVGERAWVELGVLMPNDSDTAELEGRVRRTIRRRLPQIKWLELSIARDRMWHPGRMSDQTRRRLGL